MPRIRDHEKGKNPPRLGVTVTIEQWDTFKRHLPYGFQKQVFSAVIEDMCQMWREFGDDFTRALLAKNLTYRQFMNDYMERNYGNSRIPKEFSKVPQNDVGRKVRIYEGNPGFEEDENRT